MLFFHFYFLNMHIPLNIKLTILKTKHIAKTHLEGSLSQNVDIGFRFCFMLCRKMENGKLSKKSQTLPVCYHKMKTKA